MFSKTVLFLAISSILSVNAQSIDCTTPRAAHCTGLAKAAEIALGANLTDSTDVRAACDKLPTCAHSEYSCAFSEGFDITSLAQQCNVTIFVTIPTATLAPEPSTATTGSSGSSDSSNTTTTGSSESSGTSEPSTTTSTTSEAPTTTTASFPPSLPPPVADWCKDRLLTQRKYNYVQSLLALATDDTITLQFRCRWLQNKSLVASAYQDVQDVCGSEQRVNLQNFLTKAAAAFGCR